MPMPGSRRSPSRRLASVALMAMLASAQAPVGDAGRGRGIVLNRSVSTCLLCHAGPFADAANQGTIGPSLAGVGARLSVGEIRMRIVDPARENPQTVMPSFGRSTGLTRVGRRWEGQPILDTQQIEDVVAYLATLGR